MLRNAVNTFGVVALMLLAGCVQHSDTLNRPQASTLPADSGDMALQNGMVDSTPAAQTPSVQSGRYHPNVVAYFRRSCENSYELAMEEGLDLALNLNDCRYDAADIEQQFADHVVYQDKDVAVVISPSYFGEYGDVGYAPFNLLDLHTSAGQDELFWCYGHDVKASRKDSRITMSFKYNTKVTEVFDLKIKTKETQTCKILRE